MTSCTGVLKEAVKLILDLSIMQLGVLTASHFLGRVFGVLRFLVGLCSFCGQQLGIGFGIAISKAVLYVLKGGRISRSSLSAVLLPLCCGGGGGCASVIWDSLGHARVGYEFIILLEKLAWEAWFRYLEVGT